MFLPKAMRLVRTVKVSEKGQIAIPADIRRLMKVTKGTTLVLITDGQRLFVERESDAAKHVAEDFSAFLKATEESLKEVWDNDEDAIWDQA